MVALLALLIFITSNGIAASSDAEFPYDKIRLPGNVIPVSYQVHLHPNITDGKFGVTGNVRILVNVKEDTDSIILHSKSLVHHHTEVYEHKDGFSLKEDYENSIPIKGTLTNEKHEQVMIQLGEKLSTQKRYVIYIQFSGKLQDQLRGFYKSSYKTKGGEQIYLATSHFEPTGARLAFPCFDEPAMKAKFSIIMVREKIHSALSNMPVDTHVSRKDGLVEDHFKQSVRMSTYLVAFVVSDFAHLSTTSKRGIKIRVWAPRHLISQAEYAIKVTPQILDYYEQFFQVNFPLPKQDLIAIPDFGAGAMENWGLITYRLTALLYDKMESSSANKQRVAVVIAHELAHQWFGNLVTMKWWNDLWLNEGFAAFVEFFGSDLVAKSWQMFDQFVIDNVQRALALDSKLNSHPISVPVKDPADIGGLFDTISYQKGSSIIRMMQDFIRADRFRHGLAAYLNKYKFGNAASNDLWSALSKATGGSINVKKIMDTWTLQMGYPVINVIRDPNDKEKAILTQERFVSDVKSGNEVTNVSPFNYKWEVPLTYYFQHNKKEQRNWLHLEDKSLKISWKANAGWLKINVDQIGFYRVNYDTENWRALAAQLKKDHKKLSPADRANIIDDAFALADTGKLTQIQALDLTEYLKNEKEYVPFVSALSALGRIGRLLLHRRGHANYVKYILQQISPLVHELGWEDTGSHLNKFLRGVILHTAVSYNSADAVKAARDMYHAWMVDQKRIPTNLRSTAYLAGIKYGGQKEWDYMFQRYKTSIYPSEKKTLMYALAETSDPAILKRYLENSLNKDVVRTQDTSQIIGKIASNPIGTKMARNFVMTNWHIIYKRYGTAMTDCGRIIKSVFGRGKTKAELAEAENFLTTHKLGSGKLAGKQTTATIRNNVNWLAHNERSVEGWLERKVGN